MCVCVCVCVCAQCVSVCEYMYVCAIYSKLPFVYTCSIQIHVHTQVHCTM